VDNVVKKAVNDWYSDRAGEYNKPIAEPGRLFDVINKYDTYN
jgi:hypothetical protein